MQLADRAFLNQDLGEDVGWQYKRPKQSARLGTRFKLTRALPWRRFKKGSVLTMKACHAPPSCVAQTCCHQHPALAALQWHSVPGILAGGQQMRNTPCLPHLLGAGV